MAVTSITMMVLLVVLIVLVVGGILLQIFLSKRESKWFGLILPAITFAYSLLAVFNVAVNVGKSMGEQLVQVGAVFLMSNIPTIVLLGIYFGCREKRKIASQLDKMNIQDLD